MRFGCVWVEVGRCGGWGITLSEAKERGDGVNNSEGSSGRGKLQIFTNYFS